ncbi:hypothetical protein [Paenibacillus sp. FSL W7-1332]|uniref:hypothetical protein n=1 Tax=Paenibacillus sp. FSL W7-1332 TaxID=2921702 RepID=UPI0030CE6766
MTKEKKFLNVGLVMPIAPIDSCTAEHWIDVKRIITESLASLSDYDTNPKIVSEGDSTGLIHKRIVEGLYTSDIVICDVSCKNPNVMFELGMRLAFDKPTVIIKDDQTGYAFDTGVIEHLQYPRDLRYKAIVDFKEQLAQKVKSTFEDSLKDPNHSPFLKSFGTFRVSSLKEDEVSPNEFIIRTLQDIQVDINELKASDSRSKSYNIHHSNFKTIFKPTSRMFDAMVEVLRKLLVDNSIDKLSVNELIPVIKDELNKMGFNAKDYEIRAALQRLVDEYGSDKPKDT